MTNSSPSPPRRRKTVRSDSPSPPRKNTRSDSPSPPRKNKAEIKNRNDDSPPRKPKSSSGAAGINNQDSPSPPRKTKEQVRTKREETSSGHSSGLQSGRQFGQKEKELKIKRDTENAKLATESQSETIYRDKRGRKLDALTEFMRQSAVEEGKKLKIEEAQYEWGRGSVQKAETEAYIKELNDMANVPFARLADDPKLELEKKSIIREGDPMAEYFHKKKVEEEEKYAKDQGIVLSRKKMYKGPWLPPNRFQILPGYRWDGIDRGNKFEEKLLKKVNEKASLKEDQYRWSSSDL